jgi:hypothetical protein
VRAEYTVSAHDYHAKRPANHPYERVQAKMEWDFRRAPVGCRQQSERASRQGERRKEEEGRGRRKEEGGSARERNELKKTVD